ncbi:MULTISPECIES: DUF2304 domain-containing protein [Enterococcus]|uniref:DUF2304 domain-containing protein n=1 Tax=Enterococcus TaxID=1350 RepID=UPI002493BEAB|nr:DUF2304 domain-containing protein [Enterococcus dispar]
MSLFYTCLIIISLIIIWTIVKKVNSSHFFISMAIEWVVIGIIVCAAAIFPDAVFKISRLLGFEVPSNFVIFSSILFLSYQLLNLIAIVAKQNRHITNLIQEVSILKKKVGQ